MNVEIDTVNKNGVSNDNNFNGSFAHTVVCSQQHATTCMIENLCDYAGLSCRASITQLDQLQTTSKNAHNRINKPVLLIIDISSNSYENINQAIQAAQLHTIQQYNNIRYCIVIIWRIHNVTSYSQSSTTDNSFTSNVHSSDAICLLRKPFTRHKFFRTLHSLASIS